MAFIKRNLLWIIAALAAYFLFFRKGAPKLSVLQGAA